MPITHQIYDLIDKWQAAVAGSNLMPPPDYHGQNHRLSGLVDNSAAVVDGSAFVARIGTVSDGHRYIDKAIQNGARLIIGQHPAASLSVPMPEHVSYWQVDNSSAVYAWLAAAWNDFPSHHLVVIGVTGTDGKTTTVNFLHQMLTSAGVRAGMLSTLKATIGTVEEPLALHVTTPEAPTIQRYLRRMVDAEMTHCILETTSHGLAQHRVTAVAYDIAVVTNITHEHLDYHGTHAAYVSAKKQLFDLVAQSTLQKANAPQKTLILNVDDPISTKHLSTIEAPVTLFYGIDKVQDTHYYADNIQLEPWSTRFDLYLKAKKVSVATRMFGLFNVYNIIAAAATAHQLGLLPEQIQQGIGELQQLYGRMQLIDQGQPFLVLVDFAHTPNSLARAIEASRKTLRETNRADGKIIAVFGSAGLRDPEKRELMAKISAETADLTILTAEDPRTESLDDILATMVRASQEAGAVEGGTLFRIPDRSKAIYLALTLAAENDLILICGKGHEQSMCFGMTEYPWDDVQATQAALTAFLNGDPPPNSGLPTW